MELDEAEREGVEPFEVDTAKLLFSMEGRGRLIWRNRHKHNAQVTQPQLSRKLRPIPWICRLRNWRMCRGSIEAVRQAASVQPSTCISYQLHICYVCSFRTPRLYVACHTYWRKGLCTVHGSSCYWLSNVLWLFKISWPLSNWLVR